MKALYYTLSLKSLLIDKAGEFTIIGKCGPPIRKLRE